LRIQFTHRARKRLVHSVKSAWCIALGLCTLNQVDP
jgi:hypothetical protein